MPTNSASSTWCAPSSPPQHPGQWTLDNFHKAADDFDTWGHSVHDASMQFVFHNHFYEFAPQGTTTDGTTTGFDEEFDMYSQAGQDPSPCSSVTPTAPCLLHVKDRIAKPPPAPA